MTTTKLVTTPARAEGEAHDVSQKPKNRQDPLHQLLLQLCPPSLASPKKWAEKEAVVVLQLEDEEKRQMGRMKRLPQTVLFLPLPKPWQHPAAPW